jgi:hypothetical protein
VAILFPPRTLPGTAELCNPILVRHPEVAVGHHYVPQKYLSNFQCPGRPAFVWMHDKHTGEARQVAIKQAAQSKDFYGSAETENMLANEIERPANPVIQKIIAHEPIDSAERHHLAYYVGSMLMRVPANRRKLFANYPGQLAEYFADLREQATTLASTLPDVSPERLAQWMANLDDIERRFIETPPGDVVEQMLSPLPFRNMVDAVEAMTWRILVSSAPQYFCTSDNPAFFFTAWGLASQESELSFPLSTTHALHGSWQDAGSLLTYVPVTQHFVKEINRRLASTADRAFYHERADWLLRILPKVNPYLSRLRWSHPPRWRALPLLAPDGMRLTSRRTTTTP